MLVGLVIAAVISALVPNGFFAEKPARITSPPVPAFRYIIFQKTILAATGNILYHICNRMVAIGPVGSGDIIVAESSEENEPRRKPKILRILASF